MNPKLETRNSKLVIGTRSSKLALWQANHIKEELQRHFPDLEIILKEIKTKGDHITDVALSKVGGKGLFTKEIEDALLQGEIDLACHSLKDLPTKLPDGLKIGAILKREKPHDVLISKNKLKFKDLPGDSKVGTSSLRRVSQLKALRQDLEYVDLRGNLDTRIKKLDEGKYDAIVLAYAGIKRLGFEKIITEHFNPKEILPAVGQGTLAIEISTIETQNSKLENIVEALNDKETYLISLVERAFLETLQGGCQVPIGAYSEIKNGEITIYGMIASLDGKKIVRDNVTRRIGELEDWRIGELENWPPLAPAPTRVERGESLARLAETSSRGWASGGRIGKELAERLLQKGGEEILREINAVEAPHRGVSTGV